ncbi:MAG: 4,5-DOPA dioxygenase extradiol [Bdellovibrionaceae bacterium]|nr:4,5-DOPA dioxygenase extradiol [Pseudobdellovibrionaceae bacterium]
MKMPVFFIGHGSPTNALEDNAFTRSLQGMRKLCPEDPKAVLCISAHWLTEGSWITHMKTPKTIHDFYGFPQPLFEVQYPAMGSPELADLIVDKISDPHIHPDDDLWGLDHGTWSVLRHIYPDAEIPVLQLSIDLTQPAQYHYDLGVKLRKLRDRGVLIVGSGNVVHNLRKIRWSKEAEPYDWAIECDEWVKTALLSRNDKTLIEDFAATEARRLSVPTTDHYYPLLYSLGAAEPDEVPQFTFEDIQLGSISMLTMAFGANFI